LRKTLVVAVAAATLFVSQARAQTVNVLDLSAVTCKQLFEMKPEQISLVLAWMQANYAGENDPPRMDLDRMSADKAKLAEYCAKNPSESVIEAGNELFDNN
jgi:acid stress chaperone HdeB